MNLLKRILRGLVIAYGLTLINLFPLVVFHVLAPVFAPIIGGYFAGENLKLNAKESVALGIAAAALIGLPLPVAQQMFGYFSNLSTLAVNFFSIVGAVYVGGLVGILAWFGGNVALAKQVNG